MDSHSLRRVGIVCVVALTASALGQQLDCHPYQAGKASAKWCDFPSPDFLVVLGDSLSDGGVDATNSLYNTVKGLTPPSECTPRHWGPYHRGKFALSDQGGCDEAPSCMDDTSLDNLSTYLVWPEYILKHGMHAQASRLLNLARGGAVVLPQSNGTDTLSDQVDLLLAADWGGGSMGEGALIIVFIGHNDISVFWKEVCQLEQDPLVHMVVDMPVALSTPSLDVVAEFVQALVAEMLQQVLRLHEAFPSARLAVMSPVSFSLTPDFRGRPNAEQLDDLLDAPGGIMSQLRQGLDEALPSSVSLLHPSDEGRYNPIRVNLESLRCATADPEQAVMDRPCITAGTNPAVVNTTASATGISMCLWSVDPTNCWTDCRCTAGDSFQNFAFTDSIHPGSNQHLFIAKRLWAALGYCGWDPTPQHEAVVTKRRLMKLMRRLLNL